MDCSGRLVGVIDSTCLNLNNETQVPFSLFVPQAVFLADFKQINRIQYVPQMDGKALVHMDVEGARQVSSRSTWSYCSANKSVVIGYRPVRAWRETRIHIPSILVFSPTLFFLFFSSFLSASPSTWLPCRWPRTWWIWSTATAAWRKTQTTLSSTGQTRVCSSERLFTINQQSHSKAAIDFRELFVPPRCHFTKCPSWHPWRVSEPEWFQWFSKNLLKVQGCFSTMFLFFLSTWCIYLVVWGAVTLWPSFLWYSRDNSIIRQSVGELTLYIYTDVFVCATHESAEIVYMSVQYKTLSVFSRLWHLLWDSWWKAKIRFVYLNVCWICN